MENLGMSKPLHALPSGQTFMLNPRSPLTSSRLSEQEAAPAFASMNIDDLDMPDDVVERRFLKINMTLCALGLLMAVGVWTWISHHANHGSVVAGLAPGTSTITTDSLTPAGLASVERAQRLQENRASSIIQVQGAQDLVRAWGVRHHRDTPDVHVARVLSGPPSANQDWSCDVRGASVPPSKDAPPLKNRVTIGVASDPISACRAWIVAMEKQDPSLVHHHRASRAIPFQAPLVPLPEAAQR